MRANPGAVSVSALQLSWTKASEFLSLTKPRLTSLVLFTTLVGFYAGTPGSIQVQLLVHTLIGTALIAGGSTAFNMYRERDLDALMKRTALRPLAAGKLSSGHALLFALAISAGGFAGLYIFVNHLTSFLSAVIFASYIFLYTPLKTKTWLCTFVGAVPGALPVVMGWTAARSSLSPSAWILFAIVFLWQIPHFHAIGWMHRDDYARAGLPMLSVIDAGGDRISRQILLSVAVLIAITILPFFFNLAGSAYLAGAAILGLIFLGFAAYFARKRNPGSARKLFIASAIYLPALFILLMIDRLPA